MSKKRARTLRRASKLKTIERMDSGEPVSALSRELAITRRHEPILLIAAVVAITSLLAISVPTEAKDSPSGLSADQGFGLCLIDQGDSNWGTSDAGYGCEGEVCYCCYDDGCYICDNTGQDCTFDSKASRPTTKQRLKEQLGLPTTRPTKVSPGSTTRPPRVRLPNPGLLEGGSGLPKQSPAPAGSPVAPPPTQLR